MFRGPRAGVVFYRKGVRSINKNCEKVMYDLESRINQAVFPGLQGGPHNHAIAGIATTMKQAKTPEFLEYQKQVVANARQLCSGLQSRGYKISTDGTDVHMILVDLKSTGITGAKAEKILEEISIACNKNTVPGDKSALNPSGIRLGTPALTTRGLKEKDIDKVVDFIDRGKNLSKLISIKINELITMAVLYHIEVSKPWFFIFFRIKISKGSDDSIRTETRRLY